MDPQERSSRTLGISILAVSLVAACTVVGLALTPPASAAVGTQVASVSQPMGNAAGTATNAVAQCPGASVLVGGGIRLGRATDTATPGNGLKVNGTIPSDSGGNPVANGAADPSFWTAVGGFGGQSELGDQVTAFVITFDKPMNPATVQDLGNYEIHPSKGGDKVPLGWAVYNARRHDVTLVPAKAGKPVGPNETFGFFIDSRRESG